MTAYILGQKKKAANLKCKTSKLFYKNKVGDSSRTLALVSLPIQGMKEYLVLLPYLKNIWSSWYHTNLAQNRRRIYVAWEWGRCKENGIFNKAMLIMVLKKM